jgi:hypothetical protein
MLVWFFFSTLEALSFLLGGFAVVVFGVGSGGLRNGHVMRLESD